MAAIPQSGTSAERALARGLRGSRVSGWRRGQVVERCRPDFVFPKQRVAVFVDGCFWHACPSCGRRPRTNVDYWNAKLDRNAQRDAEQTDRLTRAGWTVLRIWEHELKKDLPGAVFRVSLAVT